MRSPIRPPHVLALALATPVLTAPAAAQVREVADTITVQATVEAIDHTNRILALMGPGGNFVEVEVAPTVERFDELKVGDTITATYTESLALRVRKPGEPAPAAEEARAEGGRAMAQRTLSVTVEAIDRDVPSITVKGPEGNVRSFRVPDGVTLQNVAVGDSIDITYTIGLLLRVS